MGYRVDGRSSRDSLTHSNSAGLYLFAAVMAVSGALVLAVPARLVNK